MAWINPITNRESGATRLTAEDMQRIADDIVYLENEWTGSSTFPWTTWSTNTIITIEKWTDIRNAITALLTTSSAVGLTMTDAMTYTNLNNVETNLLRIYQAQIGLSDFTAYSESVVNESEEAIINDATFMDQSTLDAWYNITGGA